ncbi:hypothetical protein OG413_40885 [Streptomyces sp. NBC_01433]|uniref:hypothetical protein n=1 Tax=Streptomyces sp. NBC_01433 TaxID=2903864 RepID=UPI002258A853|nr:hypothetical protein [Streptomyces sp. NBC_01433]MCX4681559.1 hypothetical protein [Streptomyces sp. NBC_01433]
MGRRKANKQRRVRPQQEHAARADPYEDRNRRALCQICGGDLIRAKNIRQGVATETLIRHLDADRDEGHRPDLVWVWDEVQCDFCGGRGVVWSYQVAPLAAARPVWISPEGNRVLDTDGAANETPWTACGGCADLIEAGKWEDLVQAFTTRHLKETGESIDPAGAATIRATQHQFVAMRTGARVLYATSA